MVDGASVAAVLLCGSFQRQSSNQAALDVLRSALERHGVDVVQATGLTSIPTLDLDLGEDTGPVLASLRGQLEAADLVAIAAPEYGGALAGGIKNVLDWMVGGGELHHKVVLVLSAGTTGGHHARQHLVQTLTWQGAYVVGQVGIEAPRTKSDAGGRLTDGPTVDSIEALADLGLEVLASPPSVRVARASAVVLALGIDPVRVAPVLP